MLLILLGEDAVAGVLLRGTKSENAGWLTIVLAWGLAVMIAIFPLGRISGAHLNSAVTLALFITGDFPVEPGTWLFHRTIRRRFYWCCIILVALLSPLED